MSTQHKKEIGVIEVPVQETTWSVVSFEIYPEDLKNNECENMNEFIEKVKSEDIDIFDLLADWTNWETVDSEVQEIFYNEACRIDSDDDEIL